MNGPRLLAYSHDGFGLGHLRRNVSVASRFVDEAPGSSALLLAGLPGLPGVELPQGVDLVKLPGIRKVATETWNPRSLRVDRDRLAAVRREMITAIARSFQPDLVLVDYVPGGVWGELVGMLERRKASASPPKVVLGLRDVLDAPDVTRKAWADAGHDEVLAKLYDRVVIYGDPKVFDTAAAYGLEDLAPGRVESVGYVGADEEPRDAAEFRATLDLDEGERLVLATAGGGYDAFPLMELTLDALELRRPAAALRLVMVPGPLMPLDQVAELQRRASRIPGASVVRVTGDLLSLMNAADLVVTMGAYNTVTEAVRLGRPVISVPRRGPSAEQATRVRRFHELGLLEGLPADATPPDLRSAIDRCLTQPRRPAVLPSADGLAVTARRLVEILDEPSDPAAHAEARRAHIRI